MPRWIDPNAARTTTRQNAARFEKEFDAKQPVSATLPAVLNEKTPQLSELAARALGLTGNYAALVKALAQAPHKETRLVAINALRAWLGESPKNGPLLKDELDKSFPSVESSTLYGLLRGFSSADARDAERSGQLIDFLESEHLAVRELAFFNLNRITRMKYDYDATKSLPERTISVNRWRTHLKKEGGTLLKK